MRRIFERFMNSMTVLVMLCAVGGLLTLLIEGMHGPFGFAVVGAPLVLFFNYVILGKLTLWHRQDSSRE